MMGSGMTFIKSLFLGMVGVMAVATAHAATLGGTASVSITSDTAAAAKNIAMDEARRQIIMDALSKYSMPDQLRDALAIAPSGDLNGMIATTSISGEQQSDTTYSANITMTLDSATAAAWMNTNAVQNWLPDGSNNDKFVVIITMSDPIADWMQLQQIARDAKIDLATKYMNAGQVTVELPTAVRGEFTAAVRGAGWRYGDMDGTLRIWK